ncbi:H-NS histone family protein [Thauera humireducens]|uniref:H-NS histone family protein n=1 Tax=Thauera humireducens TaxID=1134435 RepID=UPI00311D7F01
MKSFADYSLPQLKKLQMRITTEIERRESDTKASLLKRLRKLAQTEGIKLEDLLGCDMGIAAPAKGRGRPEAKPVSVKRATLPAKYSNPNNLEQSWSGRGRKPAWFEAWVANGGSITALENAASIAKRGRRGG